MCVVQCIVLTAGLLQAIVDREKTTLIESDSIEKANHYVRWTQPLRPPADTRLNMHLSDAGIDYCAKCFCACWWAMRTVHRISV